MGKSHLLAALACQLVLDKERLLYIPDCHRLFLLRLNSEVGQGFLGVIDTDRYRSTLREKGSVGKELGMRSVLNRDSDRPKNVPKAT